MLLVVTTQALDLSVPMPVRQGIGYPPHLVPSLINLIRAPAADIAFADRPFHPTLKQDAALFSTTRPCFLIAGNRSCAGFKVRS
jgi:hypothetical protein